MSEPEKPFTTITTHWIHRLNKTTISIGVSRGKQGLATINLPIILGVYKIMLKALAQPQFSKFLPLTFLIDNKGTAYNVMPKEVYDKRKTKQAETTKNDSNTPKSDNQT